MKFNKRSRTIIFFTTFFPIIMLSASVMLNSEVHAEVSPEYWDRDTQKNHINIKSITGKFYAYIVLLFSENPYYLNLIQEDSITPNMGQNEDFYVREYSNYLESIKSHDIKKLAELLLDVYINPNKFNDKTLESIQEEITKLNIILRFSKVKKEESKRGALDFCIYGKKEPIYISHPFFEIQEKMFNIQPFIYYDEFSTSNSTFYFDMIYIDQSEVNNDFLIAQNIINGINVETMLFVGAKINDNIKYCILHAFKKSKNIKKEIFNMFVIHELTHKVLNNKFNYYDQVTGEELSLLSTIYQNPYLGLSVLYSYLDYTQSNSHRIAAMNIIRYLANKTGKPRLIDDPGSVKYLTVNELKRLIKEDFLSIVKNMVEMHNSSPIP